MKKKKEVAEIAKPVKVEEKLEPSEVIWNEIKDLPLNVFGLANQKVSMWVFKVPVPGKECLLTLKASSVYPVLEEMLSKSYDVDMNDKYVKVLKK